MRGKHSLTALFLVCLGGCFGGNGSHPVTPTPTPTANVIAVTIDGGPNAATGQINHAYVTVNVCKPGTSTCASIDHVLVDTGSTGLRLVGSVLSAQSLALPNATDSQGNTLEECVSFTGGQTWGPVATADVTLAGEKAASVPVQVMNDTNSGAAPPGTCGANGTLINDVGGFGANGVLGVGVFAQDCGQACVSAATPLPVYYGCSAAGACAAENVALSEQVTNVVTLFASDNNGIIISLPNLANANGDTSVHGEMIFGLSTQADNMLPVTGLTVLGADSHGDFTATYNGSATVLPALIDSGTDAYAFDDPNLGVCSSGAFVGYYCPAVAPQPAFTVNTGVGSYTDSSTIDFAIADPDSFVVGAAAVAGLAEGGGSSNFVWGMPFFYGRPVYFGIEQRVSGIYTGPYYAY